MDQLKATVSRLESRVEELESRLHGSVAASTGAGDGMRMILIGPPGAGEFELALLFRWVERLGMAFWVHVLMW